MADSDPADMARAYFAFWNETMDLELLADRYWHDDFEWVEPPTSPNAGTFAGRGAAAGYLREWFENMGTPRITIEGLAAAGAEIAVATRSTMFGTKSEVQLETPLYFVLRARGDRFDRIRVLYERGEALRAVGLAPGQAF